MRTLNTNQPVLAATRAQQVGAIGND
jgi:hypothetical protein